jgi:hypothetical protein
MNCGSPANIIDWFGEAAGVGVFAAERPPTEFPGWLREQAAVKPKAATE